MIECFSEETKKMYLEAIKWTRAKHSKRFFLLSAINSLKLAEMDLLMCKPEAASLVHSLVTVLDSLEKESKNKKQEVKL